MQNLKFNTTLLWPRHVMDGRTAPRTAPMDTFRGVSLQELETTTKTGV